jgi:hypothetical protein
VKFNRQYFRFIERGAVRIAATSPAPEVEPVAFINPGGGYVVVASTVRAAELTVTGLPPGRYGITYTTDREYDVNPPPVTVGADGSLSCAIPRPGVITVWAMPGAAR